MLDPGWQRAQEIFADVVLRPNAEREASLTRACGGNDELRAKVCRLLEADAAGGDFIEETLSGASQLLTDAIDPLDPVLRHARLGKYEILDTVGYGGFGKVYSGHDPDLKRNVAIKTCGFGTEASIDPHLRQRFFREAQIAAGLQHPNIVTVHDFGSHDDLPFIVQELLTGEDLQCKIERRSLIATSTRLDYLMQIARGLAHAHDAGVLHRDVKPSNVRVLETDRLKILDFGIARVMGEGNLDEHRQLTTEGVTIGTVGYLAPEQLDGETVDGRADIFSFGVLAYELLSYVHPFPGKTFSQISYQLMFGTPKPLSQHWPQCSTALEALVHRCLEKDRTDRYENFHQVIDALDEIIAGDASMAAPSAVTVAPTARLSRVPRHMSSRRAWSLAAAVLLLVATGVWYFSRWEAPVRDEGIDPSALSVSVSETPHRREAPELVVETTRDPEASEPTTMRPQPGPLVPNHKAIAQVMVEAPSPAFKETSVVESAVVETSVVETSVASMAHKAPAVDEGPTSRSEATLVLPPATEMDTDTLGPTDEEVGKHHLRLPKTESSLLLPSAPRLASTQMRHLVVEPLLVEQPEPRYPSRARRRRQEAQVFVAVLVGVDGRVADARVRASSNPGYGFDEEAVQAALAARFQPGSRNGVDTKMWSSLEFDFRLP